MTLELASVKLRIRLGDPYAAHTRTMCSDDDAFEKANPPDSAGLLSCVQSSCFTVGVFMCVFERGLVTPFRAKLLSDASRCAFYFHPLLLLWHDLED